MSKKALSRYSTHLLGLISGLALLDLMTTEHEAVPIPNEKVLCRHTTQEAKRAFVKPSKVETLLKLYMKDGKVFYTFVDCPDECSCYESLDET